MTDPYTRPEFDKTALVTIDVQRDFLDDGTAAIQGTTAVLPQISALLTAFRAARLPIIHVVRLYRADGTDVDLCRRAVVSSGTAIVRSGTAGSELAAALAPQAAALLDPDLLLTGALQQIGEREWVMYKPRWGAFYRTRLEDHLRSLTITTLAFAGCNFPNCPRTSIYEASERDFRVVLVEDAVSGLYDRGRAELQNIGVNLMSSTALANVVSSARLGGM